MEQVSFCGDPKVFGDVDILETLGQSRTPALIGVVARTRVGKENPQLRFVLNNYLQNTVTPCVPQSMMEDRRAYDALLQRAKLMAFLAGQPSLAIAEEALSRAFNGIAHSMLTSKFKVGQSGLRAYVNRIIQRKVWEVISELRNRMAKPLSIELAARGVDPCRAIELEELPSECDQRLANAVSKTRVSKTAKPGSSTLDVRKHRERKRRWKRLAELFPGMRLHPRKQNGG